MGALTREEHEARVMLLGYDLYKEKGGYYVRWGDNEARVDAETLEPITRDEARSRNLNADRTGKYYYD